MWLATLEQAPVEGFDVFPQGDGGASPRGEGRDPGRGIERVLAGVLLMMTMPLALLEDSARLAYVAVWIALVVVALAWVGSAAVRRARALRTRCEAAPHHVEGEIVAVEDDGPALSFEEVTGLRSARSCRVATVREFLVRTDDGRLVRVAPTPHALVWLAVPRTDELRVGARVALHGHAYDAPLGTLAGNDGYRHAQRGWTFDGTADTPLFVCVGRFEKSTPAPTPRVRVASDGRAAKSLEHEEVREDTRDAEIEERLAEVEIGVARVDLHQEVADA
ncbi:MAG: hypothetical protein H6720_15450 [Sandaracinus sp.]|nr:hypothetical protein [Sandaracinus sp.]